MEANRYILIEHPDCCCGNCAKILSIFATTEQRDNATILLLNGGPINSHEERELCDKQLSTLREEGKITFEGDPPIEWLDLASPAHKEPPPGLLMSMAIRYDHGLSTPGYYDQEMFQYPNKLSHAERLDITLSTMRQLWEEVTGNGFYRHEKEEDYLRILNTSKPQPSTPA